MTGTPLDFYFDISCPYAYIASTRIEALARRTGAELRLKPILLGGVYRAIGTAQNLATTMSPGKARHNALDMHRWARLYGVELHFNPKHPVRTVTALRCMLAAGEPFGPLMHAFYKAYWVEGRDLSRDEEVAAVLRDLGLPAEELLARARSAEVKAELFARTDEALAAGIFGVPGMVVEGELFWGQDRLDAVERRLAGRPAAPSSGPIRHPVDFWFDYSSPYAYLGSTRAEGLLGDKVRFRPMLLGAVFKLVGAPNVPLLAMNEPKRRYSGVDLQRQAKEAGVELNWPSHFPLRSVLPLRVTLAAGGGADPASRALVHRLFRAVWVEDRDASDPEVVRACCADVGLDGESLLAAAQTPPVKQELFDETTAAVEAGIFGAPGWIVRPEGAETALFWGNDRLELAVRAARGDERLLRPL